MQLHEYGYSFTYLFALVHAVFHCLENSDSCVQLHDHLLLLCSLTQQSVRILFQAGSPFGQLSGKEFDDCRILPYVIRRLGTCLVFSLGFLHQQLDCLCATLCLSWSLPYQIAILVCNLFPRPYNT